MSSRTKELTSRIESAKIKATLKELENEFSQNKIEQHEKGGNYLQDVVDLVLATNMISVGIDIGRLNIMLINGIPKNIAEYIQASSRVGRSTQGLVVTHFDPNRAREKSYFEHFKGFHQAFYKSVEPLSVTPFTENTIEKMIASIMVTYVRNKVPGMAQNINAKYFEKEMIDGLKSFVKQRFSSMGHELHVFERTVDELSWDWIERIKNNSEIKYEELLQRPSSGGGNWEIMQSMREIDTSTWLQIKETF
nr:helicase-related protein [uncultured Draconibacterium sp.]